MYGKHFKSMYEGSMYGAGVAVFAVWGYIISHTISRRIELNPRKLADTLGGTTEEIEAAIQYLSDPDPESRHKEHDGRRLLKEGEFQYSVPSWEHYQKMKSEEDRREYNRIKQQEYRERERLKKLAKRRGPTASEREFNNSFEPDVPHGTHPQDSPSPADTSST